MWFTNLRPAALVLGFVTLTVSAAASPQEPVESPPKGTPPEEKGAQDKTPAAAPKAPAEPFLWRIEGNGVFGYLLGTLHLPDPRVLELSSQVERAFRDSDRFYAEIEATEASKRKVERLATIPAGRTLVELAGQETWDRVASRMAAKKLPGALTQKFKVYQPWAITALLPTLDYAGALAGDVSSLDEALYTRATLEGKKVAGLETVEEQVAVFTSFSTEDQVTLLKETLDTLEEDDAKGKSTIEETVLAWLSGDEKQLVDLLDEGFGSDPALRARSEDELLWKRNLRFADRIDAALRSQPDSVAMFAIGALHMPDPKTKDAAAKPKTDGAQSPTDTAQTPASGETVKEDERVRQAGLVRLLREKGYVVTRMRAPRRAKTPQAVK